MSDIFVSEYEGMPAVTAYIDNHLEYLSLLHGADLGSIYLCRVENVVKNIGAAFLRYSDGRSGYLSLKDIDPECVVNREIKGDFTIRQGDEIIAMLETEGIKLKKPSFTTHLSVSGRFSVVTVGRRGVGASTKLSQADRKRLLGIIKPLYEDLSKEYSGALYGADFGIIIRTESAMLPDSELSDTVIRDVKECLESLSDILRDGRSRTVFSCIRRGSAMDIDSHLAGAVSFMNQKGITDYRVIHESVIYSVKNDIEKLLMNRVWLKSGAFLIIEQLESFNAIDVNTGKAIAGKSDITKKINFEAADEIFRQIRLRNLSGMILIDFINMRSSEDTDRLCDHVSKLCRKEPVHTEFIDITGLGIVELTRNKNEKSLKEILNC
jgi:ribonuclease G